MIQTVRLPSGSTVPAFGLGTWCLGGDPTQRHNELEALRIGLDAGATSIDTAEMSCHISTQVYERINQPEFAMNLSQFTRNNCAAAVLIVAASTLNAQSAQPAATKITISKQAELPRFSYPITGSAAQFVETDAKSFDAFAADVRRNLDALLTNYQIDDKSTLSQLLATQLDLQELTGDAQGGLQTIQQLRVLERKPAAKLLSGLFAQARLQAVIDAGSESGPVFEAAFKKHYAAAIAPLPWSIVHDNIKGAYGYSLIASRAALLARVTSELDPAVAQSGALNAEEAGELISTRVQLKYALPVAGLRADVLHAYIAENDMPAPEIWSTRELTLTAADHLTPVNIGIWDSGIDVSLFPNQLFTDPNPTASGSHGLAFDDAGDPAAAWTYPLTADQQAAYPEFQQVIRGQIDLQNGVDSSDARAVRDKSSHMSPAQMHEMEEFAKVLGFYAHGTHCAGIAVRGNPAARLVVARFDDQLPDFPFAPTEAWVRKMGADFQQMANYFRTRQVRVVNMSWGDDAQEFETWLSKTGGGADPEQRKLKAAELFALWRAAVETAIKLAPDTLFVAAAGNTDSDAGFIEDVPASLKLPNLLTVGAVNKSGDETSFTSHGDTVLVHSDGYQVISFVPGGAQLPFSGTSMAAPNVVNLAAKLIALDPTLTPTQTIQLIRNGATASADGRRHLIDQKHSAELLKAGKILQQQAGN